jgi:hypothetical protein
MVRRAHQHRMALANVCRQQRKFTKRRRRRAPGYGLREAGVTGGERLQASPSEGVNIEQDNRGPGL